jgi:ribosomal protein L32
MKQSFVNVPHLPLQVNCRGSVGLEARNLEISGETRQRRVVGGLQLVVVSQQRPETRSQCMECGLSQATSRVCLVLGTHKRRVVGIKRGLQRGCVFFDITI